MEATAIYLTLGTLIAIGLYAWIGGEDLFTNTMVVIASLSVVFVVSTMIYVAWLAILKLL